MGQKLLEQPVELVQLRRAFILTDDFENFATSVGKWQTIVSGSGTPAVSASLPSGVLVMSNTGAGNNDSIFIASAVPCFQWANGVPCSAEFLFQFSEAATNNANLCFGFWSSVSSTLLANSSGGPPTSGTGAMIWKQGGSLNWQTISSQGTTQNKNTTPYVAGSANYTRLRIQCEVIQGVMEITYFIDQSQGLLAYNTSSAQAGMAQMQNTSNSINRDIKDYITLSSPLPMYLVFGIKNGTTTAETLNVDTAAGWAERGTYIGTR